MSNILNKVVGQLSGQGSSSSSQQQSSSGRMFHNLTDAVTGQKHPQDYQNPQMSGYPQNTSSQDQKHPYGAGGASVHRAPYAPYSAPQAHPYDNYNGGYGGNQVHGGYDTGRPINNTEHRAYDDRQGGYGGHVGNYRGGAQGEPASYEQHGRNEGQHDDYGGAHGGHMANQGNGNRDGSGAHNTGHGEHRQSQYNENGRDHGRGVGSH